MYSKLHGIPIFLVLFTLGLAVAQATQAQATAPPVQTPAASAGAASTTAASTAALRGTITDPTGALIPGATVTITTSAGATVKETTADSSGAYAVTGLTAGSYIVRTSYPGFAPFKMPAIQLAAGQSKRVDISMAMEVEQQSVTVTDESPTVNIEASGNSNAIVIKGKDLEAL